MKKVLFAVLATAALASCTQSDIINESDSSKKAISFDESYIGKTTRAVPVAGAKFAEGATIGVFSTGATSATDNFDNQKVTYDAGAWIYSPQKFYEDSKTYTFNAYTPWKEGVRSIDAAYTNYVVAADVTAQEDLMYAPEVSSTGWDGTDGVAVAPVQFIFKHALTQVKVSARTIADYSSKYNLSITGLRIKDVNSVGTLTRGTDTWSAPITPVTYTMGTITDWKLNQQMKPITTTNGDVFMLIPQSFTSDVTVELDINVELVNGQTPDANVTEGKHTITAKIPATVEKPVEWGRNKVYNYQLNLILDKILNMQPIIFDKIEIEDWAPEVEIPSTETPEKPIP